MFSTKLRSWMEAHLVRPRKKQHRKGLKNEQKQSDVQVHDITQVSDKEYITDELAKERIVKEIELTKCDVNNSAVLKVSQEKLRDERVGLNNLSSPESAYSTGYSTDGTSPGASVPPEYYINLRTGKHYVAPPPPVAPPPIPLTPRSHHRSRSNTRQRLPLPESSTEEDIASENHSKPHKPITPKSQRKVSGVIHRRTESYDEGHRVPSPYIGASPRQRNRIRTNPWHPPPPPDDSTLSSSDKGSKKHDHPHGSSSTLSSSEKPPKIHTEHKMAYSSSPLSVTRLRDGVTTCSPLASRPCRHTRKPLSSSSSAPSSGSDRHPNTSDFSDYEDDDDDATLNEMLGHCSDASNECHTELDFIDAGSLVDHLCSDSEKGGQSMNKGHCSYHSFSDATPEGRRRMVGKSVRKHRSSCDGSQASSRASSRNTRRIKRNASRQSDEVTSSSELIGNKCNKLKLHSVSTDKKFSVENSPSKHVFNCNIDKPSDNKVINLNKVLINRLINNQRCGTRSADTTPILKRHSPLDYNGKYLRNPHVSKLISSNSSLMERRPSLEPKIFPKPVVPEVKLRSNSICQSPSSRTSDKDGDLKCRQLIREAENILEDYNCKYIKPDYLSPTLSTKSAILPNPNNNNNINAYLGFKQTNNCLNEEIKSQISLLQEKINNPIIKPENDDGILKTISKTLEKIIVRDSRKSDKGKTFLKNKKKSNDFLNKESQENINNSIMVPLKLESSSPIRCVRSNSCVSASGLQFPSPSFRRSSAKFENGDIDKVKTKCRGVDFIRTTDPSYSPLRISHNQIRSRLIADSYSSEKRNHLVNPWYLSRTNEATSPLTTFKSFDLGNQIACTSQYCPQSEPVKRKVYAESSTFGKLQKSLMRRESEKLNISSLTTEDLREENACLKEKVAQLRNERLKVEARVKEAQNQIDRLNLAETSSRC